MGVLGFRPPSSSVVRWRESWAQEEADLRRAGEATETVHRVGMRERRQEEPWTREAGSPWVMEELAMRNEPPCVHLRAPLGACLLWVPFIN